MKYKPLNRDIDQERSQDRFVIVQGFNLIITG